MNFFKNLLSPGSSTTRTTTTTTTTVSPSIPAALDEQQSCFNQANTLLGWIDENTADEDKNMHPVIDLLQRAGNYQPAIYPSPFKNRIYKQSLFPPARVVRRCHS